MDRVNPAHHILAIVIGATVGLAAEIVVPMLLHRRALRIYRATLEECCAEHAKTGWRHRAGSVQSSVSYLYCPHQMRFVLRLPPKCWRRWFAECSAEIDFSESCVACVIHAIHPSVSDHFKTPADELAELVPALNTVIADCPDPSAPTRGCQSHTIAKIGVHLNDVHSWPREAIADWLESLDADLTLQPASVGD